MGYTKLPKKVAHKFARHIFNEKYENNGYAGSGYTLKDGKPERYNYAGYAAQAGTNVMGNLSIRF